MIRGEYVLYGLSRHKEVIDIILGRLDAGECDFSVRLILTEALTNAFYHGNKSDPGKPIMLKYDSDGRLLRIEVTDCGSGFEHFGIRGEISDDSVLDEKGRGLFLINCYSDRVDFKNSTLIVEKDISQVSIV